LEVDMADDASAGDAGANAGAGVGGGDATGVIGACTHAANVRKKFIPAAVKSMYFFIDIPPATILSSLVKRSIGLWYYVRHMFYQNKVLHWSGSGPSNEPGAISPDLRH
jgi:hypothetical protein